MLEFTRDAVEQGQKMYNPVLKIDGFDISPAGVHVQSLGHKLLACSSLLASSKKTHFFFKILDMLPIHLAFTLDYFADKGYIVGILK